MRMLGHGRFIQLNGKNIQWIDRSDFEKLTFKIPIQESNIFYAYW